ncbi:protein translocase subunit SecD [Georgenia sp. MJ206]|uniref:protein translocase subunit SecD n=1 Tax=Georgenia wangjunii TaxID=3117730 RepID=UPI002F25FCAB
MAIAAIFGSVATGTQVSDEASFAPQLALDLEGGTQLVLTPRLDDGADATDEITPEDLNQAIAIIRQRVDASGVAEAEITRQGSGNIVVALPGEPSEETLDLVRRSAQLRFRPVLMITAPTPIDPGQAALAEGEAPDEALTDGETATDAATDAAATDAATDESATDAASDAATDGATPDAPATAPPAREDIEAAAMTAADVDGDGELSSEPATAPTSNSDVAWVTEQLTYDMYALDCTDPANLTGGAAHDPLTPVIACGEDGTAKYVLGPADVEGTHVDSANSGLRTTSTGATTNEWVVNIEFGSEGSDLFRETSQRLVSLAPPQNQFGIVLDGLVISAPSMNSVIPDGQAQISGTFDRESASTLANQLNFGSLPLNFEVQSEEQISATLGSEHLRNGLIAGLIGLVLVGAYLVWQYRGLAAVAVASLVLAAVLTYGVIVLLSWLQGYRLSLAGVAGLIVAVGITADSFILFFERMRDEIREGRTIASAVDEGWVRARRTILISDVVTLLAAVVLYFLAVGGVRGFAFTLGLTTLIDIVVVFWFTHPAMQVLIRTRFFSEGHPMSGLNAERLGVDEATARGHGRPRPPQRSGPVPRTGATAAPAPEGPRMTIAERRAAQQREQEAAAAAESVNTSAGDER